MPLTSSNIRWQSQNLNFLQRVIIYTGKFRYKYLNRSALLTFIQFNLGKIKYKKMKLVKKEKIFLSDHIVTLMELLGLKKKLR